MRTPPSTDKRAATPGTSGGLFRRFALLASADLVSRFLRFLADILLGRHFGQVVFGGLNLAQALAVQGMQVANCGLDTLGMREAAAGGAPAERLAATIVLLRLSLGLFAWGAVAALVWFVPRYHDSFELAALYALSILTGALTVGWLAQAVGKMNIVASSILATNLVYFGGVQLALRRGWPPTSIPMILIASELLTAAGLGLWLVRAFGAHVRPLPFSSACRLLRESLPIGGANIVRTLTIGSDILLLGLFVDEGALGLYSAAFKLYSLGGAMIALYFSVLVPYLAGRLSTPERSAEGNQGAPIVRKATESALGPALLVATLGFPVAWFLSGRVVGLLFGPAFEGAAAPLQVLLAALPLTLAAGHFRAALVVLGRQRIDLLLVTLGAVIHVVAKWALIPQFALLGCGLGTVLGEAAVALFAGIVFYRYARAGK